MDIRLRGVCHYFGADTCSHSSHKRGCARLAVETYNPVLASPLINFILHLLLLLHLSMMSNRPQALNKVSFSLFSLAARRHPYSIN